jgi:hypothetical protein
MQALSRKMAHLCLNRGFVGVDEDRKPPVSYNGLYYEKVKVCRPVRLNNHIRCTHGLYIGLWRVIRSCDCWTGRTAQP